MSKTYVFYHGNCFDGFGAAYAAWKNYGDAAVYIPCIYGIAIPDVPFGSTVYMIDFSLKRDEMLKLHHQCAGNLTVLDHHKTAEENLKGLDFAHFDMNKSGAMLAWEYFHPLFKVPELIKYIQDRDLWKNELPFSKEVSAALQAYPYDFEVWDKLNVSNLVEEGRTLLRYQQVLVNMICQQAKKTTLQGYEVMVVNSTSHWSEVGNTLCKTYPDSPFCASFYYDSFGNEKWSLRSIGEFDVSAIAKQFGGGGHKNASGFEIKMRKRYE